MNLYLALLRGINVGGKNAIRMTALAASFEEMGFSKVRTYIQSGNVIFESGETVRAVLTARIEAALSTTFTYESRVVVRSHDEVRQVIAQAPEGFGSDLSAYRYDVIFLKEPLTSTEALKTLPMKAGVDQVAAGNGVLYFSRLTSRASQSHLSRVVSLPIYQSMTIRNWNTTTRLLHLMETDKRLMSGS